MKGKVHRDCEKERGRFRKRGTEDAGAREKWGDRSRANKTDKKDRGTPDLDGRGTGSTHRQKKGTASFQKSP